VTSAQIALRTAADDGLRDTCAEVRRIHAATVEEGTRMCRENPATYRDAWCVDALKKRATPRSFGHPEGTCYVGRRGKYVYVTIPKVATTVGRQWARAAFQKEDGEPAAFLIPQAAKPLADRMEGAALWRDLPTELLAKGPRSGSSGTPEAASDNSDAARQQQQQRGSAAAAEKAAVFAAVRDPLDRFASGWREMLAYERGPPDRRGWGRRVLRRQRFFRALNDTETALRLFGKPPGAAKVADAELLQARVLADAVRDLTCYGDWNEHLTPQVDFLPDDFRGVVGPHVPSLLGLAARAAGLVVPGNAEASSETTTTPRPKQRGRRRLAAAPPGGFGGANANARDGWPQPEDVRVAFDRADADEAARRGWPARLPPTRTLWCWIYAADYAAFAAFFSPPPWCDQVYRDLLL